MEYVIDGKNWLSRREAHEEIARRMSFPDFYGCNLDALYDMLSTEEGHARITDTAFALNTLGAYGLSIIKTFFDAAEKNPGFTFTLE